MEIDVTALFAGDYAPRDYSASVAEIGADAGPTTWRHSCEDSADCMLLDTEEKREAFRSFVRDSGGWTDAEISAWPDIELNALCLQWVAGDVRETFDHVRAFSDITPQQWADAESRDDVPGRLFRADDGRIFFYIGT